MTISAAQNVFLLAVLQIWLYIFSANFRFMANTVFVILGRTEASIDIYIGSDGIVRAAILLKKNR